MTRYGKSIVADRFLEERGYMMLVYPEANGPKGKAITSRKKIKIPFYENPQITENKAARYATYKLIGRNSNLYSYLGADSRLITLNFYLTLPHLAFFMKNTPWINKEFLFNQVPKFNVVKRELKTFLNESSPNMNSLDRDLEANNMARLSVGNSIKKQVDSYYNQDAVRTPQTIDSFEQQFKELKSNDAGEELERANLSPAAGGGPTSQYLNTRAQLFANLTKQESQQDSGKTKASYLYYINLIRSTVIGSSELGLGAPILRLNFGPLFQDVPFITKKYNINIEQSAGYDIETLLPNRVKITLNLEEVRTGDFSTHNPQPFGESDDNVATWESLFAHGTLDPRSEPRLMNQASVDKVQNSKESDIRSLERRNLRGAR